MNQNETSEHDQTEQASTESGADTRASSTVIVSINDAATTPNKDAAPANEASIEVAQSQIEPEEPASVASADKQAAAFEEAPQGQPVLVEQPVSTNQVSQPGPQPQQPMMQQAPVQPGTPSIPQPQSAQGVPEPTTAPQFILQGVAPGFPPVQAAPQQPQTPFPFIQQSVSGTNAESPVEETHMETTSLDRRIIYVAIGILAAALIILGICVITNSCSGPLHSDGNPTIDLGNGIVVEEVDLSSYPAAVRSLYDEYAAGDMATIELEDALRALANNGTITNAQLNTLLEVLEP